MLGAMVGMDDAVVTNAWSLPSKALESGWRDI